jgi:hypothetical protein
MPSVSKKQHNLMEAIAHGAKPKSGKGPSPAVAKDFVKADAAKGVAYTRKLPVHKGDRSTRAKPSTKD